MPHAFGNSTNALKLIGAAHIDSDVEDEYEYDAWVEEEEFQGDLDDTLDFLQLEHVESPQEPPKSSPASVRKVLEPVVMGPQLECSVCLTSFEDIEAQTLTCGHKFCIDCLSAYIQVETANQAQIINKQVTSLLPVKPGVLTLTRRGVFGVKCPALGCNGVVEGETIEALCRQDIFDRFTRYAISKASHNFNIPACLNKYRCRGRTASECKSPKCRLERLNKAKEIDPVKLREWYLKNLRAHELFGEWARGKLVKCCPRCFVLIEKNLGCDHMYCTQCQLNYSWRTAPRVNSIHSKNWLAQDSRSKKQVNAASAATSR